MCTCGMHSTQSVDHAYALVVTYMYLSLSVDLNAKAPTLRVSTEAKPAPGDRWDQFSGAVRKSEFVCS